MSINQVQDAALMCTNCNGVLDINPSKKIARCPFCGTCYSVSGLLGESDEVKIARIQASVYKKASKAYLKNEAMKLKNEQLRLKREAEEQRVRAKAEKERHKAEAKAIADEYAASYKKSFFSKVIVILFFVYVFVTIIVAMPSENYFLAIIGSIQCLLLVVATMMGKQIIRTKNKNTFLIPILISLILVILFGTVCATDIQKTFEKQKQERFIKEQEELNLEFDWDELVLGNFLPQPDSVNGEIHQNSKSDLRVDIYRVSPKMYYTYVDECKELGFTFEVSDRDSYYTVYNKDGYKLDLSYYSHIHEGELSIDLEAPEQLKELKWSEMELSEYLPTPKSNIGHISRDNEEFLSVSIWNTSKDDYDSYVAECVVAGFDVEAVAEDNSYEAKNNKDMHLKISFKEFGVMYISLDIKHS